MYDFITTNSTLLYSNVTFSESSVIYQTTIQITTYNYRTWEISGWQIWQIMNCSPNFLANIHRYTENVFGICIICSLFNKFFLYCSPKFSPTKYFPCMVIAFWMICSFAKFFPPNTWKKYSSCQTFLLHPTVTCSYFRWTTFTRDHIIKSYW